MRGFAFGVCGFKMKKLKEEIETLRNEFLKAKDLNSRKYIIQKIISFVDDLEKQKYRPEDLKPIKERLKNIEKYTQIYDYGLSEQLTEQKTIIADSIQSSPMHIKKIELKNTAMVQFPEIPQN